MNKLVINKSKQECYEKIRTSYSCGRVQLYERSYEIIHVQNLCVKLDNYQESCSEVLNCKSYYKTMWKA